MQKRSYLLRFTLLSICLLITMGLYAQDWQDKAATIRWDDSRDLPEFVRLRSGDEILGEKALSWVREVWNSDEKDEWEKESEYLDPLGMTHIRLAQKHEGYPVFGGYLILHLYNGNLRAFNGQYVRISTSGQVQIDRSEAINQARQAMGATRYMWQVPAEENWLKIESGDPKATYFPQPELFYAPADIRCEDGGYRLCYRTDLYAAQPLDRKEFFVDAQTGEIHFVNALMHSGGVNGTAETAYSGTQPIVADTFGGEFILRDDTRGGGVMTFDMNSSSNLADAIDFIDADNYWNNVNADEDEYATDAHWGSEVMYDWLDQKVGLASFDNNDAPMLNYVHWSNNWLNASFDGTRARFGDGSGGYSPLTALDIVAHEYGHGVTGNSAGLVYAYEPGALNESFSDIIGEAVEFYGKPAQFDWLVGGEIGGGGLRNMSNPQAFGDPDTYLGNGWAQGSGDNGGVHTNSGVQNFWFYLLTDGGSGTNDNGDAYSVQGLGMDTAVSIAMRTLLVYLGVNSDYEDARYYHVQSAIDLYGECSHEMIQTMNAWHACGVGGPFSTQLESDFYTPDTAFCAPPAEVEFENLCQGALNYLWIFGDGTTSTDYEPVKTYNSMGTFDVTLIAYGCSTAVDTFSALQHIFIDPSNPCRMDMEQNDSVAATTCTGKLRDSGGPGNYLDNNTSFATIAPPGAVSIELTFTLFEFAASGDYIAIYDGPDVNAPLIGYYNGTSLPNGGVITSTGGSITLKEVTNGFQNFAGFELDWACTMATATEDALTFDLDLWPNPAEEVIHVRYSGEPGLVRMVLTDMYGRVVLQHQQHCDGSLQVDHYVPGLARGVYFMQVENNGRSEVKKIILR